MSFGRSGGASRATRHTRPDGRANERDRQRPSVPTAATRHPAWRWTRHRGPRFSFGPAAVRAPRPAGSALRPDADALSDQLESFEAGLRELFDAPELHLAFDRRTSTSCVERDGTRTEFEHLPDVFSSMTDTWGALTLCIEGQRRRAEPLGRGWALLDEPELHLPAELQERLRSFLAETFPRVQFIVATHAPAALASLEDATVFDLRSTPCTHPRPNRAPPSPRRCAASQTRSATFPTS